MEVYVSLDPDKVYNNQHQSGTQVFAESFSDNLPIGHTLVTEKSNAANDYSIHDLGKSFCEDTDNTDNTVYNYGQPFGMQVVGESFNDSLSLEHTLVTENSSVANDNSIHDLGKSFCEATENTDNMVYNYGQQSGMQVFGESFSDSLSLEHTLVTENSNVANDNSVHDLGTSFCEDTDNTDNTTMATDLFAWPLTSTPHKSRHDICQEEEYTSSLFGYEDEKLPESDISSIESSFDEQSSSNSVFFEDNQILNIEIKKKKGKGRKLKRKLLNKALLSVALAKFKMKKCKRLCHLNVENKEIKTARYRFWTKTFNERVEWFSDKYSESSFGQENIRWFSVENGRKVCPMCFMQLHYISKDFYYGKIAKFNKGAVSATLRKERSQTEKVSNAADWLNDYAVFNGDRMPDRNIVLLPYKTRKIDVYKAYEEEQNDQQMPSISRSAFYKLWQKKFTNLKIKQTNAFSKCNTCTNIHAQYEASRSLEKKEKLKTLLEVHNNRQRMERRYYKEKRNKAKLYKNQYLSIIIDGMDQAKTNLPHFTGRMSNDLDLANLLSTHVQGVVNHGLGRFAKYIDIKEYQHDSNMVMNTILKELFTSSQRLDHKLPPILFIQADNCFRENKNRFVLGFCELLVRKQIFKEVHLSFLMVGHTHEDVDAGFSKISDLLRRNEAGTLPRLLNLIPETQQLRGLYDIKTWLMSALQVFSHHTKPHHFKFSTDSAGKVLVQYKGLQNRPWTSLPGTFLKHIPTGIPKILQPNFSKLNVEALGKNIEKCKFLFSNSSEIQWWNRYISFLKQLKDEQTAREIYAKSEAKWVLPLLPQQSQYHENSIEDVDVRLREMVDVELDDPEVLLQPVRRKLPANVTGSGVGKQREGGTQKQKKKRT